MGKSPPRNQTSSRQWPGAPDILDGRNVPSSQTHMESEQHPSKSVTISQPTLQWPSSLGRLLRSGFSRRGRTAVVCVRFYCRSGNNIQACNEDSVVCIPSCHWHELRRVCMLRSIINIHQTHVKSTHSSTHHHRRYGDRYKLCRRGHQSGPPQRSVLASELALIHSNHRPKKASNDSPQRRTNPRNLPNVHERSIP